MVLVAEPVEATPQTAPFDAATCSATAGSENIRAPLIPTGSILINEYCGRNPTFSAKILFILRHHVQPYLSQTITTLIIDKKNISTLLQFLIIFGVEDQVHTGPIGQQ